MSAEGWIVAGSLGGVALGGVIGFVTHYFAQRWARQAAVASERRQARVTDRRKALALVTVFLDIAAKADASGLVLMIEREIQKLDSAGILDHESREKVRDLLLEQVGAEEDVMRAFAAAAAASPTQEILGQLMDVWLRVGAIFEDVTSSLESLESLRDQIHRARELVEEYILDAISE